MIINNLTTLEECKNDIKNAIIEKGVDVTNGMIDYGTYIRNIPGKAILRLPKNTAIGRSTFTISPAIDTREYTSMKNMFYGWHDLKEVNFPYNTSRVTNMTNMFHSCDNLEQIKVYFDCSKVKTTLNIFQGCTKLYNIYGLNNMGQQSDFDYLSLTDCPQLSRYAIRNIFNTIYDRASVGYSTKYIYLHHDAMSRLNNEDIAIATNKGWTVVI